jgi:hypothetical protein
MNSELVQSYARRVLYWLAGALVSHGVITAGATWVEPTIGVLLTIVTFAWSLYGDRLNGLLARVQGKDGVIETHVTVDADKIDPAAVTAGTPSGVTAK